MKILIVGRTFHPNLSPRSFRTTELSVELAKRGHNVTVILPRNIKHSVENEFKNKHSIDFEYYGPLKWKSLEPSHISWIGDWKRKFGRLLFLLFDYPNIEIYSKLPSKLNNMGIYDLAITIAVPHENHWAFAKARSKINPIAHVWVADCGDPFLTNHLERISPPKYFAYLENSFLKKADYISVPTEGSIKGYNSKYRDKMKVIPQGFDFSTVKLVDSKPKYNIPHFAYAGGVTKTGVRSLHEVIKFLKSIDKPFKFFIFSGSAENVLSELIQGYEKHFIINDPIPREKLLYELSKMDFLVNLDNDTSLNTPSKLIDYALTERPVLNISPINPEKNKILNFLDGDYSQKLRGINVQDYDIQKVADQFLECCNKV